MVLLVIGLFEFCNHGLCTCNLVSYLDFYFGAERQEHIGPGAELDEAYLLSCLEWLFVFSVADHAPCKEAGDLTAEHFRAVFIAEYDCGPLVLGGGLGMPCSEVVASVVTEKRDDSGYRSPVDVDIEKGHEYRNLESAVMEILGLFDFLYDDDCAVCRRRDSVRVSGGGAFRVTEKAHEEYGKPYRNEG